MASWLSEDLNKREVITTGPTRLIGWSLANTGTEERFVGFKSEDKTGPMVVVPPGDEKSMSGLRLPFPFGLAIESLTGDGTLIANVFFEVRKPIAPPDDEVEDEAEDEPSETDEDEEA